MSVATAPAPPQTAPPTGSTSRSWGRRGRSRRPAAAVIARGEPMLWLTAGALAVAVFMIVGLVTLVVIAGGRTFWPGRLTQVELLDGRTLLGEVVDSETYELTSARLAALPEAGRPAAEALLKGKSSATARRTLLRVDNKQLTGEPFVWVDDLLRKPDGTTQPEWAVTVERTSWGRFLGTPEAFVVTTPRPVSGAEQQLDRLIAFFEENAGRLDDATREKIAGGLDSLKRDRDAARANGTADWLAKAQRAAGESARAAVLDGGEEVPLDQLKSDQPVTAIRETWAGPEPSWSEFEAVHGSARDRAEQVYRHEKHAIGDINARQDAARMAVIAAGLKLGEALEPVATKTAELDAAIGELDAAMESRRQLIAAVIRRGGNHDPFVTAARTVVTQLDGEAREQRKGLEGQAAAAMAGLSPGGKAAAERYRQIAADARRQTAEISSDVARLRAENDRYVWRLTTGDGTPQEIPVAEVVRAYPANRLGFGGRLGVYLSRWGEFLSAEPREANTEGGVFPAIWGTVAMTLIMTLAVVPFGVLAALFLREYAKAGPVVSAVRIAVNNLAGVPSIVFGVFGLGFFCYVVGAGIDRAAYPEYVAQNTPVFGTGGLLWASLTLALLTLPVVIVATEEALAAVPNSMREGSYACGASKWQTIRRIVLPRALPGILTGMILAMARGAGEVAPLMLVGAAKIAPELPVDASAPFVHLSRSFMHLGFHIYDLGFQSPDSTAAKPMVFTTTLLLISIVAVLNVLAIRLRSRLRRRFMTSQF